MLRRFESLVDPYPEPAPQVPPDRFLPFIWAATRGLRPYLLAMALLTAAVGVFEALLFALLGRIVDWLAVVPPARLWTDGGGHLLALAGVLAGSVLLVGLQTVLKHQTLAGNFPMLLRWRFHRLMLAQSLSFYQEEFAGRIATKVLQTALAVRDTWFILADILVFVLIYFLTIAWVVSAFHPLLLLPLAAWAALYALAVRYFVPRLGQAGKAQADARSVMTGRITDAYTNIGTVKLFSHTLREAGHARDAMREFMHTVHGQMRLVSGFEAANHAMSMVLISTTCGAALWLWSRGQAGLGAVAAATAMALRLNGISHWVMWEMTALFEHMGTVQDGLNMLSRPQTVLDRPGAPPLRVGRGEVRFDSVLFSYGSRPAGGGSPVIDRLDLVLRPGEKVGLVGRSGAGKSTLVNLLLRFHDLESGRILVDGQDVSAVTQDSLRAAIGVVTQDTALLHRSVRENILYGRPDATEAELVHAARRAQAHDFILGLRDARGRTGYDAHVGERGVRLSGGQRQRIAIARVLLKDAPILILDEATSALDSEVEAAIQANLQELMQGKTVLAIAHRLSTIAALDRLVVLEAGRVAEQGTHASLLAAGGIYAGLWARQSGGFLGEAPDQAGPLAA